MSVSTPWDDRRVRITQEAAELEEHGYAVTDVEDLGGSVWRLRVAASAEKTGDTDVRLDVVVPASYPYMAPFVYSSDVSLKHHQNPFSGHLCLIERSTENWNWRWRLAGLLDNQLSKALAAGEDLLTEVEESRQGEPFSAYYTYARPAGIVIDSTAMPLQCGESGSLDASVVVIPGEVVRLLGVVDCIHSGASSYKSPSELHRLFTPYEPTRVQGRWTVHDRAPDADSAEELWRLAVALDNKHTRAERTSNGLVLELRAIGFPEEQAYRATAIGWICVVKHPGVPDGSRQVRRARGRHAPPKPKDTYFTIPVYHGGRTDLAYRAPETRGLEQKSVLVIGCGAIGSVLTEQLARAGVGTLHLLDGDTLEPGNLSRHAGSFHLVGLCKAAAMAAHAESVHPYVRVQFHDMTIGSPEPRGDGTSETDYLTELIHSVDLVIDATAEIGVQEYTSILARAEKTDWMCAYATPGIAGGIVARIGGDSEACFSCFAWHQYRGTIPKPVSGDSELVQPAGCAAPTFTGTGFDLSVVALQGARVAVAALLDGLPGGYPKDGNDAYVLTLRDGGGRPCPPLWEGFTIERHEECQEHA